MSESDGKSKGKGNALMFLHGCILRLMKHLTPVQIRVATRIAAAGQEGIRTKELIADLGTERSALCEQLKKLAGKGMITRSNGGVSGRPQTCRATAALYALIGIKAEK